MKLDLFAIGEFNDGVLNVVGNNGQNGESGCVLPYSIYPIPLQSSFGTLSKRSLRLSSVSFLITLSSGDSTGSTAQQSEQAYDNVLSKKPNNLLALNHETESSTVFTLLPFVLNKYKNSGYKFVTVAECLGMDPYVCEYFVLDAKWGTDLMVISSRQSPDPGCKSSLSLFFLMLMR